MECPSDAGPVEQAKPVEDFISYDVRKLADADDLDIVSLREMEVFSLLHRKDDFKVFLKWQTTSP